VKAVSVVTLVALLIAGTALAYAASIPGPEAPRAVVWAVGDAATPGPAPDRLAGLIRLSRPDLFLYLGDVYESGTRRDFRRYYQPRFGSLAGITMPTIGNHEWTSRFSGYYPYWARKKGHPQPPWSKRTRLDAHGSMGFFFPAQATEKGIEIMHYTQDVWHALFLVLGIHR